MVNGKYMFIYIIECVMYTNIKYTNVWFVYEKVKFILTIKFMEKTEGLHIICKCFNA